MQSMLQRIQTLFLLAALVLVGLMSLWPLATIQEVDYTIFGEGFNEAQSLLPFPMSYIGYGIMAFLAITIFLFKDRKRQLLFGRLSYLLLLAYIVVASISLERVISSLADRSAVSYGISLFLPLLALGLVHLANRGIKRDEELVRSLDRLR
jgi:uncharacterized membrane protein